MYIIVLTSEVIGSISQERRGEGKRERERVGIVVGRGREVVMYSPME